MSEAGEQARPSKQSMGGKARAAKMTPQERSEGARKAVSARWAKRQPCTEVTVEIVTGIRLALSDARWPNDGANTWNIES